MRRTSAPPGGKLRVTFLYIWVKLARRGTFVHNLAFRATAPGRPGAVRWLVFSGPFSRVPELRFGGPAKRVSARFRWDLSGPRIMAIQTIKPPLDQTNGHEQASQRGRHEFARQLRIFHPGRMAGGTSHCSFQDIFSLLPLADQFSRSQIVGLRHVNVNCRLRMRDEPKPLEPGIVVDRGVKTGAREALLQLLGWFHLLKSCQRYSFHALN